MEQYYGIIGATIGVFGLLAIGYLSDYIRDRKAEKEEDSVLSATKH